MIWSRSQSTRCQVECSRGLIPDFFIRLLLLYSLVDSSPYKLKPFRSAKSRFSSTERPMSLLAFEKGVLVKAVNPSMTGLSSGVRLLGEAVYVNKKRE